MKPRGFSTLEMMIAFAILATVLAGVIMADFGAQYWTITSQTANEALYKAKVSLENLRASAKQDFLSAVSSPLSRDNDASCLSGSLCYYLQTDVIDVSPCSKYASTTVSWQVQGYPTTTAPLATMFSDANSIIKLGGDCGIKYPGDWSTVGGPTTFPLAGTPTGIDTLNGSAYIVESQPPYLEVIANNQTHQYISPDSVGFNAIDVARSLDPNRPFTYAYVAVASTTDQLHQTCRDRRSRLKRQCRDTVSFLQG